MLTTPLRGALLLALLLAPAPLVCAEEATAPPPAQETGALTLERIFDGKPLTTPVPRWSWRPGHLELVHVDEKKPETPAGLPAPKAGTPKDGKAPTSRFHLIAKNAETGQQRILLDLSALDALIGGKAKTAMRGIGRAGPPRFRFDPSGNALCAVVKGDLVWVDLVGSGGATRLTRTRTPMSDLRVSPDARHVSFARDHDLWVVATTGGPPRPLTSGGSEGLRNSSLDWVYPEEFGFRTGAWWSPDSKQIAYIQLDERKVPKYRIANLRDPKGEGRLMRYPRAGEANPVARVGVVPVEGGKTTWLDVGKPEYIVRVTWTPDAKRLLLVTLDRHQQHLKLHSCDPVTGESVLLFEERDPCWVDAPPAPWFLKDNDHVFMWRSHDGGTTRWWMCHTDDEHVTVLSQLPLTPADMDAGHVLHVSFKDRIARYAATPHGSTVRSVYEGWGGSESKLWTMPAALVEDTEASTNAAIDESGRFAIVTWSDPVTPPRSELRLVEDGTTVAPLGDARSAATNAIVPADTEEIAIPAPGGGKILMRLWKPADLGERLAADPDLKLPMIVSVYAGPGSRTVGRSWGRGHFFNTLLTRKGYLVLRIDGRGTGAQGAAFKRCVYGRMGLCELDDQVRGAQFVADRSYVDQDRIGVWGWSFGGTMTCNALTIRSDVFKVGVAVAPVTDWRQYDTIYTERYMGLPSENKKGYDDTSSLRRAKSMGGSLLLLHGIGDDNVHPQNTFLMVEELLKHKHRTAFDWVAYPWRGHGIQNVHIDVFSRLVDWFDRNL